MNLIKDGADPLTYIYEHSQSKCNQIEDNPKLKELLTLCFKADHEERPTAKELLAHPFFEESNHPR